MAHLHGDGRNLSLVIQTFGQVSCCPHALLASYVLPQHGALSATPRPSSQAYKAVKYEAPPTRAMGGRWLLRCEVSSRAPPASQSGAGVEGSAPSLRASANAPEPSSCSSAITTKPWLARSAHSVEYTSALNSGVMWLAGMVARVGCVVLPAGRTCRIARVRKPPLGSAAGPDKQQGWRGRGSDAVSLRPSTELTGLARSWK